MRERLAAEFFSNERRGWKNPGNPVLLKLGGENSINNELVKNINRFHISTLTASLILYSSVFTFFRIFAFKLNVQHQIVLMKENFTSKEQLQKPV